MSRIIEYKDEVEFVIESGKLIKMVNHNLKEKNVVIPHKLETSEETIDVIGTDFCMGCYSKIFISDGISKAEKYAFRDSRCKEVRWSTDCKEIPDSCFTGSKIKIITNIEHVDSIGECAFIASDLRDITWPSSCKKIPAGCFCTTNIMQLLNTSNVGEIGVNAFENSLLTHFEWPSKCATVPKNCFLHCAYLKSVSNMKNISAIERSAFAHCGMSDRLDLSEATAISFSDGCFEGVERDKVIFPYYTDGQTIEKTFKIIPKVTIT